MSSHATYISDRQACFGCIYRPTQELRGLGLANLVGAAFNCYTTTGSFSRSAVMNDVGAKTQLAGITSGAQSPLAHAFMPPVSSSQPLPICMSHQMIYLISQGPVLFYAKLFMPIHL